MILVAVAEAEDFDRQRQNNTLLSHEAYARERYLSSNYLAGQETEGSVNSSLRRL